MAQAMKASMRIIDMLLTARTFNLFPYSYHFR